MRKENTGRVEKLLLLKMPVGVSIQDGKAGLLGHGDGCTRWKFRHRYGLRGAALNGLATGRAGCDCLTGSRRM